MGNERVVACKNCRAKNRLRPRGANQAPRCGRCGEPLPWVADAGDADFDAEIAGAPAILVDFWAAWCGPCRVVAPVLEDLAADWAGRLKIVKVDVDKAPRLAARFGVQSIPLLMLFRDGQPVYTQAGAQSKPALEALLHQHLS